MPRRTDLVVGRDEAGDLDAIRARSF